MSRNRNQSSTTDTTPEPETQPEPETPEPENVRGVDTAPSATAAADLEPGPQGTDPAAQSKISGIAGVRSSGDLASELGSLPAISALDGIKSNAAAGYYKTVPAEQLVADLQALTFENEEHVAVRDALVERARGGAFSGK